jgi:hypothetical protein
VHVSGQDCIEGAVGAVKCWPVMKNAAASTPSFEPSCSWRDRQLQRVMCGFGRAAATLLCCYCYAAAKACFCGKASVAVRSVSSSPAASKTQMSCCVHVRHVHQSTCLQGRLAVAVRLPEHCFALTFTFARSCVVVSRMCTILSPQTGRQQPGSVQVTHHTSQPAAAALDGGTCCHTFLLLM